MTFNFLTGQPQLAYDPSGLQQYQQLWNTGAASGMNYSNVLAGGNAMPAAQGIDWSVLGPWALSQAAGQGADWQSILAALAGSGSGPNQPTGGQASGGLLGAVGRRPQLGQVDGQPAGYVGPGLSLGIRPVGMGNRRILTGLNTP